MIWAELQKGMIATSYTPDMIELPPGLELRKNLKGAANKTGERGDDGPARADSRRKSRRKKMPVPAQHAIASPRLGHNIVIAKHVVDPDPSVPGSRPGSRAGVFRSSTPLGGSGRASPAENSTWWNFNGLPTPRLNPERPMTSEGPARTRHRVGSPAAPLPSTTPRLGGPSSSSREGQSQGRRPRYLSSTLETPRAGLVSPDPDLSSTVLPAEFAERGSRQAASAHVEEATLRSGQPPPVKTTRRGATRELSPSSPVSQTSPSPDSPRLSATLQLQEVVREKVMAKAITAFTGDKSALLVGTRESPHTTAGATKIFSVLADAAEKRMAAVGGITSPASLITTRPKSKLAATLERLSGAHTMERMKTAAQGNTGTRPGHGHQGQTRTDAAPEIPKMLTQTIKRVICGDSDADGEPEKRLPADRQTTYTADDLAVGARELNGGEREKIAAVFREMAKNTTGPQTTGPPDKSEKGKDGKESGGKDPAEGTVRTTQDMLVIHWSEVQKRLRGRLSSAHIQRLGVYFGLKGRVRIGLYMERIGFLATATPEKRLRIAFGLLDVGGDSVIGRRDIFAALASTRIEESDGDDTIDAVFTSPGPFGIDFADSDISAFEVVGVVAAAPAEQQGVRLGSRLSHVNGMSVDMLTPQEVRLLLLNPARPLSLTLRQRPEQTEQFGGSVNGMFEMEDLNKLLRALGSDRVSSRIKVQVMSAKSLRNADSHAGKSDPYCQVEIPGKPHTRWQTRTIVDSLEPEWKEERDIADFMVGDTLKFTVRDKDFGKNDEILGRANLGSAKFVEKGVFEGDLVLLEANSGQKTNQTLRVKVSIVGEGGIGMEEFAKIYAESEPAFLAPLQECLTGILSKSSEKKAVVEPVKIRVNMIGASGLRNADMGGKSDPYCICEIAGRTRSQKVQTKTINDTLDPVWNERKEMQDYLPGEALRFAVFDSDPGKSSINDDLLGQVTVSSVQFWPGGFEGELALTDGGRNFSPTLRIKITTPQSTTQTEARKKEAEKEVAAVVSVEKAAERAEAMAKFEADMKELKLRLPHLKEEVFTWHSRVFQALCDDDIMQIRRGRCVAFADRLFGVPVGRIAGRFFDEVSKNNQPVSVLEWSQMMENYRGIEWDKCQACIALAFSLYDLDNDGIISVQDAVGLSREVDRLTMMYGEEGALKPVCEEMRWLYGLVANTTDGTGQGSKLDLHMFKQVRPQPLLIKELTMRLDLLAEETARKQQRVSSEGD